MEDQFDGVDAAFEMLLEEIRRSQESLKQAGSKAFADGDLPRVGAIRDELERLEAFLGQVSSLPAEWQKIKGEQQMAGDVSGVQAPKPGTEWVSIGGHELKVNTEREAVLPGCGLFNEKFQDLARFAQQRGELPDFWVEDEQGNLIPRRDRYSYDESWTRSAYRHLERALFRIAQSDGLL